MERLGTLRASRAPVRKQAQRRGQFVAVSRQRVRHPRRTLLVRSGNHDPLALQPPKPVGQDVRRNGRKNLGELVEAAAAIEQRLDEQ